MASGIGDDPQCLSVFDRVWDAAWSRKPTDLRNLTMLRRISRLVRDQEYDLVHVHTPIASFVTRLALNKLRQQYGLRIVYTAHGFHFHPQGGAIRNKLFETLERRAAKWTDFLVVMNQDDLKAAQDIAMIPPHRLCFMPGIGIDRSRYSTSSVSEKELRRLYAELGLNAETPVLLMLAEFVERKRHADAIQAFSRISDSKAQLILAGTGPLLEPMRRLAVQLGVADRVHFLGARNDVPVLMKASRALILPSSQEGLPRAILEAMSMGLPVIGSRIRGTADLLKENAGLLLAVGDIDGLSRAMQLMIDDPNAAAAMGRNGQVQSERYDLAHILRMHEEIYRLALQLPAAATVARTVA